MYQRFKDRDAQIETDRYNKRTLRYRERREQRYRRIRGIREDRDIDTQECRG